MRENQGIFSVEFKKKISLTLKTTNKRNIYDARPRRFSLLSSYWLFHFQSINISLCQRRGILDFTYNLPYETAGLHLQSQNYSPPRFSLLILQYSSTVTESGCQANYRLPRFSAKNDVDAVALCHGRSETFGNAPRAMTCITSPTYCYYDK